MRSDVRSPLLSSGDDGIVVVTQVTCRDEMTDPDRPVRGRELREELEALLRTLMTREEMNARFDELHTHFDIVAERCKTECRDLLARSRRG
jgi:hypothetical protein